MQIWNYFIVYFEDRLLLWPSCYLLHGYVHVLCSSCCLLHCYVHVLCPSCCLLHCYDHVLCPSCCLLHCCVHVLCPNSCLLHWYVYYLTIQALILEFANTQIQRNITITLGDITFIIGEVHHKVHSVKEGSLEANIRHSVLWVEILQRWYWMLTNSLLKLYFLPLSLWNLPLHTKTAANHSEALEGCDLSRSRLPLHTKTAANHSEAMEGCDWSRSRL